MATIAGRDAQLAESDDHTQKNTHPTTNGQMYTQQSLTVIMDLRYIIYSKSTESKDVDVNYCIIHRQGGWVITRSTNIGLLESEDLFGATSVNQKSTHTKNRNSKLGPIAAKNRIIVIGN